MQKIIYLEKGDEPQLPADASESERLEVAVRWINRKVESTVHFGLIQIGYYLLNHFFAGDVDEALSRNPHKHTSFRKLCQRPDLAISSTHLVNAVKLVVQEKALGAEPAFRKLAVSHKIALLSVTDTRAKKNLARQVVDEKLSVRALNRQIKTMKKGRAEVDAEVWSRRLRQSLAVSGRLLAESRIDELSAAEAAALDVAIADARRALQSALAELRGIRSVAV